jgi:DNA-binding beta-propeller fold protein YncE
MRLQTASILFLTCAIFAETPGPVRKLVDAAPHLPLTKTEITPGPPAEWKIGYPSAVAMANDGTIYILQRPHETGREVIPGVTADPVIVVDGNGRVLRSWGNGLFKIPHTVRIDKGGNIWTVDSGNSMVYEFTPAGKKLMEISIGEQPVGKTGPAGSSDIAFAPNGHLFITDGYGNSRVLEYSADGKRLHQWGSPGNGPGQFNQPHGIAIDDHGIVYVADRRNGRLQRFDMSGKYLGEFSNLGMVTTVAFRNGDLWIGTQEMAEPTSADGWLMKIDRNSGAILASVESDHSHHVLNIAANGDLLSGARPNHPLWFHNAAKSDSRAALILPGPAPVGHR